MVVHDNNKEQVEITLTNVLYVPDMRKNLISVNGINKNGHSTVFNDIGGYIKLKNRNYTIPMERDGKLYVIRSFSSQIKEEINYSNNVKEDSLEIWHQRLGHIGKEVIKQTMHLVNGIKISHSEDFECQVCAMTKMTAKPFKSSTRKTTEPLQLVHSDIAGPMKSPTVVYGETWAIVFVDDYSHEVRVYTMHKKSQALEKFQLYIADTKSINKSLKCIRTDNGGEYISKKFQDFCRENGIKHELTIPYTPQQNGVAERTWRILFDMARTMLKQSGLGNEFWGRAIKMASYIKNRCLNKSTTERKTPYEICYGTKPDLSDLKIFGCPVYAHQPKEHYSKLDDRAKSGLFMGFVDNVKGYAIYLVKKRKFIISKTVKFLEISKEEKKSIIEQELKINNIEVPLPTNKKNNERTVAQPVIQKQPKLENAFNWEEDEFKLRIL